MAQTGASASSYSFPTLKAQEILLCLKGLDIPMSVEELKAPTETKMMTVYSQMIEMMMGVTKDELRQPQFGAMDHFQFPELHEESLTSLGIYRHM